MDASPSLRNILGVKPLRLAVDANQKDCTVHGAVLQAFEWGVLLMSGTEDPRLEHVQPGDKRLTPLTPSYLTESCRSALAQSSMW